MMTAEEIRSMHSERVESMKRAGIVFAKYLGPGDGRECKVCRRIIDHVIPMSDVIDLPPPGCTCKPNCLCVLVAVDARSVSA